MKPVNSKEILCVVLLNTMLALGPAEAVTEPQLDKRVVDSETFQQDVLKDPWEYGTVPSDSRYAWHCVSTPGSSNALRAQNLAATHHFAEAIGQWIRAIDAYEDDKGRRFGIGLNPEWLLSRARLYQKLQCNDEVLADLERCKKMEGLSEKIKFNAALLYFQLGKYDDVKSLLSPLLNSGYPSHRPNYQYLLAVVQQQEGHSILATKTFTEAASLYAACGAQSAAEGAIAAANRERRQNQRLKLSDLPHPRSNYENIEKLLKGLATRSDAFNLEVLKDLTGAKSFIERKSVITASPAEHCREISHIRIDTPPSGGKHLVFGLQPLLCSIDKSALDGLLGEKVEIPQHWRPELARSEAYRVPAGTLVLSIFNGGFNSIWQVALYSKDAVFPNPPITQSKPIVIDSKEAKYSARLRSVNEALWLGNLEYAEKVARELLQESPHDTRSNMLQAQICAKRKDFDSALNCIDNAIAYCSGEIIKDKTFGNTLQILRGSYLIEKGRFQEAFEIFQQRLPTQPTSDQLLLRAKSEIGLKNFSAAREDLIKASEMFYVESRILERDISTRLLSSLDEHKDDAMPMPAGHPINSRTNATIRNQLQTERSHAKTLTRKLESDKRRNQEQNLRRQQNSIKSETVNTILAVSRKESQTSDYILALLHLSTTAKQCGQLSLSKDFTDKAIGAYLTYTPRADHDTCTRMVIQHLRDFDGVDFQNRVEKVAKRSELFCDDETFQNYRDNVFLENLHGDAKIAMLEELIKIRQQTNHRSYDPVNSLMRELPKSYKGRGHYKELAAYTIDPRSLLLAKPIPNPITAEQLEQSAQFLSKTERILDAVKARNFDQSETLIEELNQNHSKRSRSASFKKTIISALYDAIAESYFDQSELLLAEKYLRKSLDMMPNSEPVDLAPAISLLSKLRGCYESLNQFHPIEALYKHAIQSGIQNRFNDSSQISEVKMSLAEVLLNHSRNQTNKTISKALESKANELFDESRRKAAKGANAGKTAEDIKIRHILAQRYPKLTKLDLSSGTVICDPDSDGRNAVVCDDKRVCLKGNHSIAIKGKGNGRLDVRIDGQTLTEKAIDILEKGNPDKCEKLLTSALRADATSEAFGLLGECWYLQGNNEDALQASSMALELNSNNAHAAAIQTLCRNDSTRSSQLNPITKSLLLSAVSNNSGEKPITVAICLFALGRQKQATAALSDILKRTPDSYRATTMKSKCGGMP